MGESGLSPETFRARAARRVSRVLGLSRLDGPAREALLALAPALAPALDLVDGLSSFPAVERRALAAVVAAKAGRDELGYARRLGALTGTSAQGRGGSSARNLGPRGTEGPSDGGVPPARGDVLR